VAAGDPEEATMAGAHRRPRPRPFARTGPAVRTPGLAGFLGRHPRLGQQTSILAIAGGVIVFIGASVAAPLATANIAAPQADRTTAQPVLPFVNQYSIDPAAPSVRKLLRNGPDHAKHPAPVSHGVISGLAANGIPSVALNAYRVAAVRMSNVEPSCGIDWALLAGIGREESDHGRFAGAVLHADGVSTPPIIGPALDGVHWDYIPAPANGLELDGDAKYAHALGPMQFIPSTWAIYGTDATGDGKADIFNINDAALGAARYLCAAGGDLRTHTGQVRAVLAYNHSDEYLAQVLALADAYRRGIPITGLPVGITTGSLPTVTDTGYIPPANPSAPTAAGNTGGSGSTPKPKPTASKSTSTSPTKTTSTSGTKTSSSPTATKSATSTSTSSTSGTATTSPSPSPTTSTCGLLPSLINNCG
jgi:Transglycosylase SLT domain